MNAPESRRYDLFVSYAHADDNVGHVAAMVAEIQRIQQDYERAHLRVFFDRSGLQAMDDWERRILEALKSSKAMLVVLSPAYFASSFCRREWAWFCDRETELALQNEGIAGLYVTTVPGFDLTPERIPDDWPRNLARRQYEDARDFWAEGVPALQREGVRARMEALEERCYYAIARAERSEGSATNVPPHNPYFVGRSEELGRIRKGLVEGGAGAIVATQGLGGMGKSALAFEYAHAFADRYPGGRFLVPSEGRTDLHALLVEHAGVFGVELSEEERRRPAEALARIRHRLESHGEALLLLDNVSEPGLLSPTATAAVLPPRGVHILVTTRLDPDRLGAHVTTVETGPLPEADALRLLERYRPFKDEADPERARAAAHRLCALLGGYALLLEMAAVFLWREAQAGGVTYPAYTARVEQQGLPALNETAADDRVALSRHLEKRLAHVLAPTLDRLTPAELRVLALAATLPPDTVVWPWLRALAGEAYPDLATDAGEGQADPWLRLQRRLHGLRLLTPAALDARGWPWRSRMHGLVQAVVLERLTPRERRRIEQQARNYAIGVAAALAEGAWADPDYRWQLEPLRATARHRIERFVPTRPPLRHDRLPFNLGFLTASFQSEGWLAEALLALRTADALLQAGRVEEARGLLQTTVARDEEQHVTKHPHAAARLSTLSICESRVGVPDAAVRFIRRALEVEEALEGVGFRFFSALLRVLPFTRWLHRRYWTIRAGRYLNLATAEADAGHYFEARDHLRHAIHLAESVRSKGDVLAYAYVSLGWMLNWLGDRPESQRMLAKAAALVDSGETRNVHVHLEVLLWRAFEAIKRGDIEEEGQHLDSALAFVEALEPDHAERLVMQVMCAFMDFHRSEERAALLRLREVAADAVERLPRHHRRVNDVIDMLTSAEVEAGEYEAARAHLLHVMALYEEQGTPDHPQLADLLYRLARVEWALGLYDIALERARRAAEIGRSGLGPEHAQTRIIRDWIAEHSNSQ